MNGKKVYYGLVGVIAVLGIFVIGGVYLGNARLQQETKQLVELKLENKILDEQQTALVRANADIVKFSSLEKIAKSIVPQDKDQARVVREIVGLAGDSGIPIQSISFPSSNLGQTAASAGSSGASAASKSTPVPSQLKAVTGSKGLYQMEITIQSDTSKPVTYPQLINFLTELEQNRRTAQVTNINVTPNSKNRKLITFSLIVSVYIKP